MKSTFLICPVRGVAPEESRRYVERLEADGWTVYWPHRDTDQADEIGLRICEDNRSAIEKADCVHLIWDGKSQGCLFDLGMAFAMRKPVIPLTLPEPTDGKSFQNMVRAWEAA
jgi:nucleoside 2-deoxyribosyltransferase